MLRYELRLNTFALHLQHPTIYGVLLELADHCNVPDVRANAVQLLNCLPTHSQVLASIRTALQGPQAAKELESLLFQRQTDAVASTRLLYTLQVCRQSRRHTKSCPWLSLCGKGQRPWHAALETFSPAFQNCTVLASQNCKPFRRASASQLYPQLPPS